MLERARTQIPGGTFVQTDMEDAAFDPGSLGGVVALYSIIHVPRERHAALFSSIASWLRPGGAFVATMHSRDDPDDFAPDWLAAGPMRWSGYGRDENLALLAAAGFDVVEHEVIEQREPEGTTIHPLWVLATKS
jgi:SAM-dependent methyltransferase